MTKKISWTLWSHIGMVLLLTVGFHYLPEGLKFPTFIFGCWYVAFKLK